MTTLTTPRKALFTISSHPEPPARPRLGWLVVLVLLAGLLVFAHGCHADVDDELFSDGWWLTW